MKATRFFEYRPLLWLLRNFLILIVLSTSLQAQNNISLAWDVEVGCQEFSEDPDKRIFIEEISSSVCINICDNQTVNYELLGNTSVISNVNWVTSGGTIVNSDNLNCQVHWEVVGFGNLQFTITYTDGSVVTKNVCIEKKITPTALFTVFPFVDMEGYTACFNQNITFTNQSVTNDATSDHLTYYWDFGDGNVSNATSPTHSYEEGDVTYTVSLTVTNDCGCSNTFSTEIKIKGKGIDISCANIQCEGDRVTYTIPFDPIASCTMTSFWYVEGGTIVNTSADQSQVEVEWDNVDSSGFGYVSFDGNSCNMRCPSTISMRIPVIQQNGTIQGESIVCLGKQYRYTLPQWPTTEFTWVTDPDSAHHTLIQTDLWNEVIITPDEAGIITLRCTYFNTLLNCGGIAVITINVKKSSVIEGELSLCGGKTGEYALLDNEGNPVFGNWLLTGPGISFSGIGYEFSYVFDTTGVYTLEATGDDICPAEFITINVVQIPTRPAPATIIGDREVCVNVPITYYVDNPDPGLVYGWSVVDSAGNVQGTIMGSNYGTEVTIVFLPISGSSYTLSVWSKQRAAPYCESKLTRIKIDKIQPIFTIGPDTPIVCASTSVSYSTTYTDGDLYNWRVEPAEAGSVSNNGSNTATILWNTYIGAPATVFLDITQCGEVYTQSIDSINVVSSPPIALSISGGDAIVCRGEQFTATIASASVPITSLDYIVWDFGNGTTVTTTATNGGATFSLSLPHTYTALIANNTDYIITATIYGANGCFAPTTASFTVTVLPVPDVSISPNVTAIFCDKYSINVEFTVSTQTGVGSTTGIVWEILNPTTSVWSPIPGLIPNLNTFSPQGFGIYSAVVYNSNGCSMRTNYVEVKKVCPETECLILPDPQLSSAVTMTLTGCNTGTVNINYANAPIDFLWECSGGTLSNIVSTGTSNSAVVTFNEIGEIIVKFTGTYLGVNGEECNLIRYGSIIVPYRADLEYTASCGPNNTYIVNLLNHSEVYPGYDIENYEFYFNGIWHNNLTIQDYTNITMSPGENIVVGIRIDKSNFAACEQIIEIDLPEFPQATFTVDQATCPNEAITFIPNANDVASGCLFSWDFDDNSSNNQPEPIKSYLTGPREVTVTVTNTQGCSATSDPTIVEVYNVGLGGVVIVEPDDVVCEGTEVILAHDIETSAQPDSYEWYSDQDNTVLADTPTFSPTVSGNYGLKIFDTNGCSKFLNDWVTVTFVKPPVAEINGPAATCAGTAFSLDGTVGGDDVTYSWELNSEVVGTSPIISQLLNEPGSYTYTLTVSAPNASTGSCSSQTQFTVTVMETPEPPVISIVHTGIDCDTYTIPLHADSAGSEPGSFSWSNGLTGADIAVNNGGPYQVRYTNEGGCSSTSQIDIPKSPSYYNWVFPSGCYDFCLKPGRYLIGPLEAMPDWSWEVDGSSVSSNADPINGSVVEDLPITFNGTHQYVFTLNTGLCEETTSPLSIHREECGTCDFEYEFVSVAKEGDNGFFFYVLTYRFTNSSTEDLIINLLMGPSDNGAIMPSFILLPAGTSNVEYSFNYYPPNTFNGGSFTFFMSSEENGVQCVNEVTEELPLLIEESKYSYESISEMQPLYLYAAPNPSKEQTTLYFSFDSKTDIKRLSVYDLLGRPIAQFEVTENRGTQLFEMNGYPSGYYLVIMVADGVVVKRTKILKK